MLFEAKVASNSIEVSSEKLADRVTDKDFQFFASVAGFFGIELEEIRNPPPINLKECSTSALRCKSVNKQASKYLKCPIRRDSNPPSLHFKLHTRATLGLERWRC